MPFSPQTFSVNEVLASSKLNQMDLNIDEVRRSHKLSTAAPSPVAGVLWLDDSATPWIWKMYDGTDWISLFTVHATNNSSGIGAEIISSGTVSAAATLDITDLSSTYREYIFVFDNLAPATDIVGFQMRTDANNGASFESGASDYSYNYLTNTTGNAHSGANSQAASAIQMLDGLGNAVNETCSGEIRIINPMDSGVWTHVLWSVCLVSDTTQMFPYRGAGLREAAQADNAIRFMFSSGNIASMNWTLYGMRKS